MIFFMSTDHDPSCHDQPKWPSGLDLKKLNMEFVSQISSDWKGMKYE